MSKKMSKQTAAELLDTLSDHFDELNFDGVYKDAIDFAVEELSRPTDAELVDTFMEEAENLKEFDFEGQTYWCNDGKVYKAMNSEVGLPVGVKTLFEIIKHQDQIEWEQSKKKLTDEQVKILIFFLNKGFKFVAIDKRGSIYFFKKKPFKDSRDWWPEGYEGEMRIADGRLGKPLKDLVSWDDTEPFDVRKALEDAGVSIEQ